MRVAVLLATLSCTAVGAFQAPPRQNLRPAATSLFSSVPERPNGETSEDKPPLSSLVNRVAVAGATGRTGKFVVEQLLAQNVPVLAMVRDADKANDVLDPTNNLLTIRQTDLGNEEDVIAALNEDGSKCDAAIWAATGFSDAPDQTIMTKLKAVFGLATNAGGTIDAVGLPALGEALSKTPKRKMTMGTDNSVGVLPKVIMLSSAGVTRPDWSEEKKLALEGSSGIPIVRLNPFGILGVKKESEEKLRSCGEWGLVDHLSV